MSDQSDWLYVCRPAPHGFVVMNEHEKFTPVLNFAHRFPPRYAKLLAMGDDRYTRETLPQRAPTPTNLADTSPYNCGPTATRFKNSERDSEIQTQ